jgi:hypothetical protein
MACGVSSLSGFLSVGVRDHSRHSAVAAKITASTRIEVGRNITFSLSQQEDYGSVAFREILRPATAFAVFQQIVRLIWPGFVPAGKVQLARDAPKYRHWASRGPAQQRAANQTSEQQYVLRQSICERT